MPKVTVIIATYGAEQYMARCAKALFGQTIDDIEYVFVDDCTPDQSFAVLDRVLGDFPHRRHQVRILRHEINKGVAAARTTGMKASTGEYVIHCDPDDWPEVEEYERMYEKAKTEDADIVVCGIRSISAHKTRPALKRFEGTGRDALVNQCYATNLWSVLVRRTLFDTNDIYPWQGLSYGEDTSTTIRMYSVAQKVCYVESVFHNYDRTNENSLSKKKFGERVIQLDKMFSMLRTWVADNTSITAEDLNQVISEHKLLVKGDLILPHSKRDVEKWISTWPETNHYLIAKQASKAKQLLYALGMKCPAIFKIYFKYLDLRIPR